MLLVENWLVTSPSLYPASYIDDIFASVLYLDCFNLYVSFYLLKMELDIGFLIVHYAFALVSDHKP